MFQGWLQCCEAARLLPRAIEQLIWIYVSERRNLGQPVMVLGTQHLAISADDLEFLVKHYGWYSFEIEAQVRGLDSHDDIVDRSIEHCLYDGTTDGRVMQARSQLGIFLHHRAVVEGDPLILPRLGRYQEILLSRPDIREKVVAKWNSHEEKKFRDWYEEVSVWDKVRDVRAKNDLVWTMMHEPVATFSTRLALACTVRRSNPIQGWNWDHELSSWAILRMASLAYDDPKHPGVSAVALNASLKGVCPCPHCEEDVLQDQGASSAAAKPAEGTSMSAERQSKGKARQFDDDDEDDVQAMPPYVQSAKSKGKARQLDD